MVDLSVVVVVDGWDRAVGRDGGRGGGDDDGGVVVVVATAVAVGWCNGDHRGRGRGVVENLDHGCDYKDYKPADDPA